MYTTNGEPDAFFFRAYLKTDTTEYHLRRLFIDNADKVYTVEDLTAKNAFSANYVGFLLLVGDYRFFSFVRISTGIVTTR